MNDPSIAVMKEILGYDFNKLDLLKAGLTARSFVNENPTIHKHNQPMATLGDAVIRLLVINDLYGSGLRDSGVITEKTSAYVKGTTLTKAARAIHLEKYVSWGKGDEQQKVWDLVAFWGNVWKRSSGRPSLMVASKPAR